ncbi:hypothetical protein AGMMS49982_07200 [Bacteroidia bacterium]|nr:hypothetical protein AGMMS49982_07200 [Bacteroidia bacterium]
MNKNKITTILTILILLVTGNCSPVTAQDFQPEWSFGVNGGVTFTEMRFNPTVPQTYLQQYEGGITFRYISEPMFGLQAELNYSMRGWKEKVDTAAYFFNNYSRSLAYIEFPLLTHVYFETSKNTRIIIHAGPQLSYFLSEKVLENIQDPNSRGDYAYYDLKVENKLDYGIAGGAGFELRTSIGKFVLEGRYFFGLSDTFGNVRTEGDYFESSGNQVIGVKMTYFMK